MWQTDRSVLGDVRTAAHPPSQGFQGFSREEQSAGAKPESEPDCIKFPFCMWALRSGGEGAVV